MRIFLPFIFCSFFFYHTLSFAQSKEEVQTTLSSTSKEENSILYKYRYGSLLTLDDSIPLDEKRNWYFTFKQQVDSCAKRFVYPEDFDASVSQAREKFRENCYIITIGQINDFENDLYFAHRKKEYDIYKKNAPFAQVLEDILSCDDCSLYPEKNSEIVFLESSLLKEKIRIFEPNSTQKDIFTNIFNGVKDDTRIIEVSKSTLKYWANLFNKAKNRTELKLAMDDFVNHITFAPLENPEELITIGHKIDMTPKNDEIVDK